MPPINASEEIIEKKSGSPVATSCLIIAVAALLAAIILQLVEMGEYRKGDLVKNSANPGTAKANSDITAFTNKVQDILKKKAAGDGQEEGAGTEGDAQDGVKPGEPPADKAEAKDSPKGDGSKADGEPEEKAPVADPDAKSDAGSDASSAADPAEGKKADEPAPADGGGQEDANK